MPASIVIHRHEVPTRPEILTDAKMAACPPATRDDKEIVGKGFDPAMVVLPSAAPQKMPEVGISRALPVDPMVATPKEAMPIQTVPVDPEGTPIELAGQGGHGVRIRVMASGTQGRCESRISPAAIVKERFLPQKTDASTTSRTVVPFEGHRIRLTPRQDAECNSWKDRDRAPWQGGATHKDRDGNPSWKAGPARSEFTILFNDVASILRLTGARLWGRQGAAR